VKLVQAYLRAFARRHTYDARRNAYLWFGFAWGLPVPLFALAFDLLLGPPGRGLPDIIAGHPIQIVFMLHPLLFALVFGAMGTLREDLELENARLFDQLKRLASTDALTGVPNRRRALEELDSALARASRNRRPFAVVMIDLDGFKQINDRQGHPAGDRVLRRTAGALRDVVRESDVLGRYGGDEFVLISDGPMDVDGFLRRASAAVREATGLSFGAGVACYPEDGEDAATLLENADAKLYEAKRATKARGRQAV
jgi:diguanylate cyclase (GGDEF)-like protein